MRESGGPANRIPRLPDVLGEAALKYIDPETSGIDFQELFVNSPNPYVLLSPTFEIVGVNDAYLRVTMRTREDLLGRNMFEAFPASPTAAAETDLAMLRASLVRVARQGVTDHLPLIRYDIPGPEGFEQRFWSATHTPVPGPDGKVRFILQHTVDVTELHLLRAAARDQLTSMEGEVFRRAQAVQETNRELNAEQQRLRRLFEQAPGFVAVLRGPTHVFEFANAAYLRLVGNRDVIGMTMREALPELAGQGFYDLLDKVHGGGQPFVGSEMPVLLRGADASAPPDRHFLNFVYQPITDLDGQVSGIFVQGHDITQQKLAQDELYGYREHLERLVDERTQALRAREQELRQAQKMEAIGQITGGVAHDFNNLLAVVLGNLELAARRIDDPGVTRMLGRAREAGERGARLTQQLLAFARKQALQIEQADVASVMSALAELARMTLGATSTVDLRLPDGLWPVETDRNQLEVAVLNLVINARDAMPDGGCVTISARNMASGELPLDLPPGNYVRLAVTDTGQGMSAETRAKAFEPFFTTKAFGQGTGLGLSQVYGFAKQQGGTVVLDSVEGRGTTVALYLPRAAAENGQAAPGAEERERTDRAERHILVVDDDADVRSLVAEGLRDLGYVVTEAAHGAAALDRLGVAGGMIDLAIVDFAMPVMDGLAFVKAARAAWPRFPIVMMTGFVDAGRLEAEKPGDVAIMRKPFKLSELTEALESALAG